MILNVSQLPNRFESFRIPKEVVIVLVETIVRMISAMEEIATWPPANCLWGLTVDSIHWWWIRCFFLEDIFLLLVIQKKLWEDTYDSRDLAKSNLLLYCNNFLKFWGFEVSVFICLKIQRSSKMEDVLECLKKWWICCKASHPPKLYIIHFDPIGRSPTATKAYSKNLIQKLVNLS